MKRKIWLILVTEIFLCIGLSGSQTNEIMISYITPSETGFRVEWLTDVPSTSQVEYGLTKSLGLFTPEDLNMVYRHDVRVNVPMSQGTIYYFRVLSKETNGNLMISDIDSCIFDRVPPVVSIVSPKDKDIVKGVVPVKILATDDIGIQEINVHVDGGEPLRILKIPPYEFEWDTTKYKDGGHMLTVYAGDFGGIEEASIDVIIDNIPNDTPPVVRIISPVDGQVVSGDVKIIVDATDDLEIRRVDCLIDNESYPFPDWPPYERIWEIGPYKPGVYTLQATVKDRDGNVGESQSMRVKVVAPGTDVTPPVTKDDYQFNNIWTNQDANIILTATDDGTGVKETHYTIDGTEHIGTNIRITEEGIHTVQYWSIDNAGNTEEKKTVTVNVDTTAPDVTISATPSILWPPDRKPVEVIINGSSLDALSGISTKVFTFTDEYNEVKTSLLNFGQAIELIAWRNGDDKDGRIYTIRVVVTDNANNSTTKDTVITVPHDIKDRK